MNNLPIPSSNDLKAPVSAGGSAKKSRNSADFKNLLSNVIQRSKPSASGGRSQGAARSSKRDPLDSSSKTQRQSKDSKPAHLEKDGKPVSQRVKSDEAMQALAMGLAVQELAGEQTADVAQLLEQAMGIDEQAVPVSAVAPPLVNQPATQVPAYDSLPEDSTEIPGQASPSLHIQLPGDGDGSGNDILGIESDIALGQPSGLPHQDTFGAQFNEDQQRFDTMIHRAQRQLQDITTPSDMPEELAPDPTLEQPALLPGETVDDEIPVDGELSDIQAEVEVKPVNVPKATARSQTEQLPTLQKPLKDLPKADESIQTMQETQPVAPREPQFVQEATPTSEQVQRPFGADQTEQIRAQVTENLEKTKMEFRMQLQPEELGKINVKLVLEGGRLAVEIMANDTLSAQLLSRQTEALALALRSSNLDVASIQVVDGSQAVGSQMDGAFNQMNGQAQNGEGSSNNMAQQGSQGRKAQDDGKNGGNRGQNSSQDETVEPQTLLNYKV